MRQRAAGSLHFHESGC